MAWFKGTSTDYHDFLDILKNLVKDDHISATAVLDGGIDYAIGDTITLAGGTKSHEPEFEVLSTNSGDYITVAAVSAGGTLYNIGDKLIPATGTYSVAPDIEVLTLSGSAVATVQINNPGICSAQPTNPVATTTGGAGSGCTLNLTFVAGTGIVNGVHISDSGVYTVQATSPVSQNTSSGSGTGAKFTVTYTDTAWETLIDWESDAASAVAIAVAGTGYVANEYVTVVGGAFAAATVVKIDTVSSGVPTAISVYDDGDYKTTPSNPAATSGGTGSGLTVTVTWATHPSEVKYLMLHNTGSDQYLGCRAFTQSTPDAAYLLEWNGFTGFSSDVMPWDQHPGALSYPETYTPLSGGASPATITYWIAVDDDRICGAFKVGSVYPNFYIGGIDKFLNATEYSYPQVILGCSAEEVPYNYAGVDYAGMTNPGSAGPSDDGPGYLRSPDGTMLVIRNWYLYRGNPSYYDADVKIAPAGGCEWPVPAGANGWYDEYYVNWQWMFGTATSIAAGFDALKRINDEYILIPATLSHLANNRIYGNLIGVFTFNPDGAIDSEDRIYIGTSVYRCFQNCNKANRNYFFCIKED